MDKIIFLDIDGVISTPRTIKDGMWGLTDDCQYRLGTIITETNAKIVLSSSWRLNTVETTKEYMQQHGFLFCNDIIGVTIRGYHYIIKGSSLPIPRGVEIKQWIDTHLVYPWHAYPDRKESWTERNADGSFKIMRHQRLYEHYNYLILDDDTDMLLEHKDHFINCDGMIGLTDEEVIKAIEILNSDTKAI